MDWNDCLTRSRRVAARTVGEKTFIVSVSESTLHLLPNEVATRVWQLADGRHSLRRIHSLICEEFDADPAVAEADLLEFASTLVARGLAAPGPCRQDDGG